jgi:hypothetical protein
LSSVTQDFTDQEMTRSWISRRSLVLRRKTDMIWYWCWCEEETAP